MNYLIEIYRVYRKGIISVTFFLILIGMLLLTACSFKPAYAEDNPIKKRMITKTYVCAPHKFLTNDLKNKHEEIRKGFGIGHNNNIVEIFVNKEKKTWTIIFTGTDGISCGLIGGRQGFTFEDSLFEKEL